MKSFLVLIMSTITPGLGQIAMGRRKLGLGILSLFLIVSVIDKNLAITKNTFYVFRSLAWLIFIIPIFILLRDYFKNKIKLLSNEVQFRNLCLIFLIYCPTAFLISKFPIFEVYSNPSVTMAPLIKRGDLVSFKKIYFSKRLPERGSVIVFKSPQDEVHYVKRLVGHPGDVIQVIDNKITLNGLEISQTEINFDFKGQKDLYFDLTPEEYNPVMYYEFLGTTFYQIIISKGLSSRNQDTFKIPDGHVYVLGDNRSISMDSRHFKSIPIENIKGEFRFVLK